MTENPRIRELVQSFPQIPRRIIVKTDLFREGIRYTPLLPPTEYFLTIALERHKILEKFGMYFPRDAWPNYSGACHRCGFLSADADFQWLGVRTPPLVQRRTLPNNRRWRVGSEQRRLQRGDAMSRFESAQRILVVNGLMSIFISLFLGWILGIALLHDWPSRPALRAIHLTALDVGFLLIIFGLLMPAVAFSARAGRAWALLLTVGAYLFYLPAILGTMWGVDGIRWSNDPRNDAVLLLGTIGTLLVSVAVPALAWGVVSGRRELAPIQSAERTSHE